ncbi:MAG: hypothetical protein ACP5KY_08535, partial [Thermoproteus sp.]
MRSPIIAPAAAAAVAIALYAPAPYLAGAGPHHSGQGHPEDRRRRVQPRHLAPDIVEPKRRALQLD